MHCESQSQRVPLRECKDSPSRGSHVAGSHVSRLVQQLSFPLTQSQSHHPISTRASSVGEESEGAILQSDIKHSSSSPSVCAPVSPHHRAVGEKPPVLPKPKPRAPKNGPALTANHARPLRRSPNYRTSVRHGSVRLSSKTSVKHRSPQSTARRSPHNTATHMKSPLSPCSTTRHSPHNTTRAKSPRSPHLTAAHVKSANAFQNQELLSALVNIAKPVPKPKPRLRPKTTSPEPRGIDCPTESTPKNISHTAGEQPTKSVDLRTDGVAKPTSSRHADHLNSTKSKLLLRKTASTGLTNIEQASSPVSEKKENGGRKKPAFPPRAPPPPPTKALLHRPLPHIPDTAEVEGVSYGDLYEPVNGRSNEIDEESFDDDWEDEDEFLDSPEAAEPEQSTSHLNVAKIRQVLSDIRMRIHPATAAFAAGRVKSLHISGARFRRRGKHRSAVRTPSPTGKWPHVASPPHRENDDDIYSEINVPGATVSDEDMYSEVSFQEEVYDSIDFEAENDTNCRADFAQGHAVVGTYDTPDAEKLPPVPRRKCIRNPDAAYAVSENQALEVEAVMQQTSASHIHTFSESSGDGSSAANPPARPHPPIARKPGATPKQPTEHANSPGDSSGNRSRPHTPELFRQNMSSPSGWVLPRPLHSPKMRRAPPPPVTVKPSPASNQANEEQSAKRVLVKQRSLAEGRREVQGDSSQHLSLTPEDAVKPGYSHVNLRCKENKKDHVTDQLQRTMSCCQDTIKYGDFSSPESRRRSKSIGVVDKPVHRLAPQPPSAPPLRRTVVKPSNSQSGSIQPNVSSPTNGLRNILQQPSSATEMSYNPGSPPASPVQRHHRLQAPPRGMSMEAADLCRDFKTLKYRHQVSGSGQHTPVQPVDDEPLNSFDFRREEYESEGERTLQVNSSTLDGKALFQIDADGSVHSTQSTEAEYENVSQGLASDGHSYANVNLAHDQPASSVSYQNVGPARHSTTPDTSQAVTSHPEIFEYGDLPVKGHGGSVIMKQSQQSGHKEEAKSSGQTVQPTPSPDYQEYNKLHLDSGEDDIFDTPALYQHVTHHGFGQAPLIAVRFGSRKETFQAQWKQSQTAEDNDEDDSMGDDGIYRSPDALAASNSSDSEIEPMERQMRRNTSIVETRKRMLWSEQSKVRLSGILTNITEDDRKLQEANFEVISSEKSYLRSLGILIDHFMDCADLSPDLPESQRILTQNSFKLLFSNIRVIHDVSTRFLAAIHERHGDSIFIDTVCDTVYEYVAHHFEPYVSYCKNQLFQLRELGRLQEQNPVFSELCKRLEESPICQGLPLQSFFMLPMQRITRLPLLIVAIVDKMKAGDRNTELAEQTLQLVQALVRRCNEEARSMERTEKLIEVQKKIDFGKLKQLALVSTSRWLVRSGEMHMLHVEKGVLRKGGKAVKQSTQIFLFNDLIIIAKRKNALTLAANEAPFSVLDYCWRRALEVEDVADAALPQPLVASPSSSPSSPVGSPGPLLRQGSYDVGAVVAAVGATNVVKLVMLENAREKQMTYILMAASQSEKLRWMEATNLPQPTVEGEIIYGEWDCPQVQAIAHYTAQQADELSLSPGEVIRVNRKMPDGWYEGERLRDGMMGWFPSSHCEEIENEHSRVRNLRQRYRLLRASRRNIVTPLRPNKSPKKAMKSPMRDRRRY